MEPTSHSSIKLGPLSTSRAELVDITKGWIGISIAFAIAETARSSASFFSARFAAAILLAAITVGIGFLLHELAHKVVAQRYGCFAEFRAYDQMIVLAIALSFVGVIIAAPGAVMIAGDVTRRENGLIAAAGSWVNIALALLFLAAGILAPALSFIAGYGFAVNSWLALFNMIPVWILDGRKVFVWNKAVWLMTILSAAALVFAF